MKKEIGIAIFFGVVLGLLVAIFMIVNFWGRGGQRQGIEGVSLSPAPKTKEVQIKPLVITQPTDGSITNVNSVTIKGKADKNQLIVIQSPIKDTLFNNAKEDFSVNFPLALGENVITISAYAKKSQSIPQVKTLRIYYLDEE